MRIISFILFVLLALPSFGQYRDVRMPEQPKGTKSPVLVKYNHDNLSP